MLVIKSTADLLKYLETRKKMVEAQATAMLMGYSQGHAKGVVYGFDEAIRAVQALLESEKSSVSEE